MKCTRLLLFAFVGACSSGSSSKTNPTYHADVQPIIATKCNTCHLGGGIAPQTLETYQQVFAQKEVIALDAQNHTMPPWPPSSTCNAYQDNRSITDAEIATLVAWSANGGPEGDSSIQPTPDTVPGGLSRVDLTLPMPAAYTPQGNPDDYHCFAIDWPETTTKYVTGFSITPGNAKIVHHAIAFIAPPGQLASFIPQSESLPDGGFIPSYPCFGGPGGLGPPGWMGAWVPGSSFGDLPAGTGIPVPVGSTIILQVHYNVANGPGESDLSKIQVKLDDSVAKTATIIPFTDPLWVYAATMNIPAGQADVEHSFADDPISYASFYTSGQLHKDLPMTVYSAAAHMHLRGTRQTLQLKQGASSTCMLDVEDWNFRWQGNYFFQTPLVVNPGDIATLDCHWNNSAPNQPPGPDGGMVAPTDLNWGERTEDEMCLGIFYVTQ